MLRSHHHLRGFVKLILWDVYCVNGYGSFRLGYVGVGFGGKCDCRYGILYASMLGGGFCGFTDVVIHQHSRKLLMMDILMSETCWTHKKWNKVANDIRLVFYSSNITMMHGPINIRYTSVFVHKILSLKLVSLTGIGLKTSHKQVAEPEVSTSEHKARL